MLIPLQLMNVIDERQRPNPVPLLHFQICDFLFKTWRCRSIGCETGIEKSTCFGLCLLTSALVSLGWMKGLLCVALRSINDTNIFLFLSPSSHLLFFLVVVTHVLLSWSVSSVPLHLPHSSISVPHLRHLIHLSGIHPPLPDRWSLLLFSLLSV